MSERAITPIPEELKKLRLSNTLRGDIVRYVVHAAVAAARERMRAEIEAFADRVYIEALGGPAKVKLIESLPEGWLTTSDKICLALDERGYQTVALRFGRARPVTDTMRYGTVHTRDPETLAEGFRLQEQSARIEQAAAGLRDTLKTVAAGVNNAHALLTVPGAVQHVEPHLVAHLMDKVRKDKLPAVSETAVAAAFAKIDGLPDQPAS